MMYKTKRNHFYTISKVALIVIFAFISTWYSLIIPPGEGVDETLHVEYVRYVKEQQALPIQPMSPGQGIEVWMGHHPPLYYVLGAVVISGIDTSDFDQVFQPNPHFVWRENDGHSGWNVMLHFGQDRLTGHGSALALYVLRWVSIALGLTTLYAIYCATEQLFPHQPWAAIGATGIICFNPSFLFMSSTVHHDVLLAAVYALTMWWMVSYWDRPRNWRSVVMGSLLLSGAVLTKASGLALVPIVAWVFILKAMHNKDWQGELRHAILASGIVALSSGWWFIRNQMLYGDLLGRRMFLSIYDHMARSEPYAWHTFTGEFIAQLKRTYWGSFGYMHITFPEISEPFWWLTGIAVLGLLLAIWRGRSAIRTTWYKWSIPVVNLLTVFVFLTLLSVYHRGSGQGRYLFPSGFSIGALFIAGLNSFFKRRYQRWVSAVVAIGMLFYAVWLPLNFVLPKYAPPSRASEEEMAQVKALNRHFVEGVELVGYQLDDNRAFPGQWVPVSLYWKATGEPIDRQDPRILLEMVDENENVISSNTMWPVPSMPPAVWEANAIYVTQAVVGLPQTALPGELFLTVTPLLQTPEQISDERVYLGRIMTTGGVDEVKFESVPLNRQETFASAVRLLGYQASSNTLKPGDSFTVSLYWEVLETPPADYTVFIHLLNAKGELITQFDRPAGGNATPTSTWQVGQVLRDIYPLSVPQDAPAGRYTIRMGMYLWPSMERLPISAEGKIMENDSIDLDVVQIRR